MSVSGGRLHVWFVFPSDCALLAYLVLCLVAFRFVPVANLLIVNDSIITHCSVFVKLPCYFFIFCTVSVEGADTLPVV